MKLGLHTRNAFSNIVSNAASKLPDDELIIRRKSVVAVRCWRASARSRLSRAVSVFGLLLDELMGRFGADPALERCLMALPEPQDRHRSGSNRDGWKLVRVGIWQCPLWVIRDRVEPEASQVISAAFQSDG